MKKIILIIALLSIAIGGYTMIETLSLEKLSVDSDIIVFATVMNVKNTGEYADGIDGVTVVSNQIKVTGILKGTVNKGDLIQIQTFEGIEDSVKFEQGKRHLLFLSRSEKVYFVSNAIQGCWPITEEGRFGGMGKDISLSMVKEAILTKPVEIASNTPDLIF